MKFIEMKEGLPNTRHYNSLVRYFEEFMALNVKTVKVEYGVDEYANPKSAQSTMINSIRRNGFPIQVNVRNGELYLTRKDM